MDKTLLDILFDVRYAAPKYLRKIVPSANALCLAVSVGIGTLPLTTGAIQDFLARDIPQTKPMTKAEQEKYQEWNKAREQAAAAKAAAKAAEEAKKNPEAGTPADPQKAPAEAGPKPVPVTNKGKKDNDRESPRGV